MGASISCASCSRISPASIATTRATTTWNWHDNNGNKLYEAGEVNLDPNGPDFRSIAGVTEWRGQPERETAQDRRVLADLRAGAEVEYGGCGDNRLRHNFDLRRLAEPLRPRSAYSIAVTRPLPGNDGMAGTADDPGGTMTYFEYPAALNGVAFAGTGGSVNSRKQTYKTMEVALTRRIARGWEASSSVSATKINAPFSDEQADNPNSEINNINSSWETTTKLAGEGTRCPST